MDTSDTNRRSSGNPSDFIKKGIHFCYQFCYHTFIKPKSSDEDVRRYEFLLNTILSALIAIVGSLDLSILYNYLMRGASYEGISFTAFSCVLGVLVILLFLSRKGYVRRSSYALIILLTTMVTYSEYRWGMSLPAGLLGYALIITISSILVSGYFGICMSVFISAIIIGLAYQESNTGTIASWKLEPTLLNTGVQYALILMSITVLSWLYWREIQKSLLRARSSEKALKEKNESLEITVEERTRALKLAQIEKISQLYRFVEFGRLSSGIFHDLLNPLSTVTSNIDTLQSSLHSDIPEIKEQISRAVHASKRMERFIETIQKQVRTEDISIRFSINTEIEESILLFEYKAKKNDISLAFYASEEIFCYGNPLKLHQVIANLISNAIDSYEKSIEKTKPRSVTIRLKKKQENSAEITVRDEGCGIPAAVVTKIFDPFFTTKQDYRGIGLGFVDYRAYHHPRFPRHDHGHERRASRLNFCGDNSSINFNLKHPIFFACNYLKANRINQSRANKSIKRLPMHCHL